MTTPTDPELLRLCDAIINTAFGRSEAEISAIARALRARLVAPSITPERDWLINTIAHCTTGHFDDAMFRNAYKHQFKAQPSITPERVGDYLMERGLCCKDDALHEAKALLIMLTPSPTGQEWRTMESAKGELNAWDLAQDWICRDQRPRPQMELGRIFDTTELATLIAHERARIRALPSPPVSAPTADMTHKNFNDSCAAGKFGDIIGTGAELHVTADGRKYITDPAHMEKVGE